MKHSLTPQKKEKKRKKTQTNKQKKPQEKSLPFPLSVMPTVKSCCKSCRWTAASVTCNAAMVTEKTSSQSISSHKSENAGADSGRLLPPQAVPPQTPEVQQASDKQQVPGFGFRTKSLYSRLSKHTPRVCYCWKKAH